MLGSINFKDKNIFGSGNSIRSNFLINSEDLKFDINYVQYPIINPYLTNTYTLFNQDNDYTDSLKFLVPLNASDSTLLRGGKLRIESNVRAKLGENTWRNEKNNDGAIEDSIIQRGNNVPIVRSRQSILSSLDGTLFQGDTIRFRATVFDRAGNSTSGEASESIFVLFKP